MSTPELPPGVEAVEGEGGLPALRVSTDRVQAEVYLHGAQLTRWVPAGHEPVLWLSAHSAFGPQHAIRGGVPVCFPWFGPGRSGDQEPAHGFARLTPWRLVQAREQDGTVSLALRLTERDVEWPQPFEATLTMTLGTDLELSAQVSNTGADPWSYELALHSYLAVHDVRAVRLTGLDAARYTDKVTGGQAQQQGDLVLTGRTDRVYRTGGPVTVLDPGLDRAVTVTTTAAPCTVVWNPWAEKAAAMPDLGAEEWTGMLCVEPAAVLDDAVQLAPGEHHTLTARYTVSRPGSP